MSDWLHDLSAKGSLGSSMHYRPFPVLLQCGLFKSKKQISSNWGRPVRGTKRTRLDTVSGRVLDEVQVDGSNHRRKRRLSGTRGSVLSDR